MSKPTSDVDPDTDTLDPFGDADREEVLALLDDLIREAHRKASSGRVYDAENERVRQGWFRTMGYLAGQYRQLMKDKDLEEMQAELELLKDATGYDNDD